MDRVLTSCVHCGLPAPSGARYCCYGCELAARIHAEGNDDGGSLLGTLSFTLVLAMVVMTLSLFLYTEDVFPDVGEGPELVWMRSACRWGSLVFASPVVVLGGGPLVRSAAAGLRRGQLTMEALIMSAVAAAFVLSAWHVFTGRGGVYVDAATAAVVLATFGRYLEAGARARASRALGPLLEVSRSSVVSVLVGDTRRLIAAAEVARGMRLEVPPEAVVPADVELEEAAEVDLAVLTGESAPVLLARGKMVPAGAVVAGAPLRGIALRPASDSALERLATLAKSLTEHASPTLRWADRFAGGLVPVVGALACFTVAYGLFRGDLESGIVRALAVVLVACPCSYAIASPLVHWLTLRSAFAHGVLMRGAEAIEAIARTRTVAFDKTGTLCDPKLAVVAETLADGETWEGVLPLVAALEADATHPVARALRERARTASPAFLADRKVVAGVGVTARDETGRELFLGRGPDASVVLTRGGAELARFELDETLRPEAREAILELKEQGLRVLVLSGDAPQRVARVAEALEVEAFPRLGPAEKLERLAALGEGVAMVGDGLNDVPALAGRCASFTLSDAAPLAKGVAQVTLLETDLRLVAWTIRASRRAVTLVQWLIGGSTLYNVAFVVLAATGQLRPVFAGLSMLVSSLLALAFAVGFATRDGHASDDEAVPLRPLAAGESALAEESPC